jgi:DNA mismatch repair protein MutS2
LAKARYGEALDAVEPELVEFQDRPGVMHPGSTMQLGQARHPLLDPATVVPIDLVLDDDTYALVITGPNTGGKTVALKTAGLLVVMAQSGLALPAAPGSRVAVFDDVLADIGDEQSIEQSLSTFSAHVANIIHILKTAGRRCLALLDELGAGTDPQEGSALARAILAALLERRVTTLVATHYPELKAYAHVTPGARNASVEFDVASLRPTYRLSVGLPGRSNALSIAERLGLDPQVIEAARTMVAPQEIDAQGLLDEIQRTREDTRREHAAVQAEHDRTRRRQAELEARLASIEQERQAVLEEARREAGDQVEGLRSELDELRRRLSAAAQPLQAVREIREELDVLAAEAAEAVGGPIPPAVVRELNPGDRVRVASLRMDGTVVQAGPSEVEVQVGRLRVRVGREELQEAGGEETSVPSFREGRAPAATIGLQPPPLEIDVRGQTVEEALEAIERRLDAAFVSGLPFVRVIHGKGTGKLRQAIRQALRKNPYTISFEAGSETEGGDGVTVIRMDSG